MSELPVAGLEAKLLAPTARWPGPAWWAAFAASLLALTAGAASLLVTFDRGLASWGLDDTIVWGMEIASFVFWLGVAHAGTLLSAVLLLLRAKWRAPVHRIAETMTVVAIACAGLVPLFHLGRPARFYWTYPYPNSLGSLWINFGSPLTWDAFAIPAYFVVSLLFWHAGLLPDLARQRDLARPGLRRRLLGIAALGWNGSTRAWSAHAVQLRLLAAIATPLFLLTSTIVALDFALTPTAGWSHWYLPAYFVTGALFSGLAVALGLLVLLRRALGVQEELRHSIEPLVRWVRRAGLAMAALYALEAASLFLGDPVEQALLRARATGPLKLAFWSMLVLNLAGSQLLWLGPVRRRPWALLGCSAAIAVGMWMERLVLVVTPQLNGPLPATATGYLPTLVDLGLLAGGFGLFGCALLMLGRLIPLVSLVEHRESRRPAEVAPPAESEGAAAA